MAANVFDTLLERGFVAQVTDEAGVRRLLATPGATFYIGFDPTADSLHVGHFVSMMVMAHLQRAGHRPIAVLGGGTGMVGDPTDRTDLRKVLTVADIQKNISRFREQMKILLDFNEGQAIMVDNADWLLKLKYVDFLRDIGACFSVNKMLAADCYKQRLEKGLTFIEFNYMLMQAYDFLELYRRHNCRLQLGGDDQWSNILAGADLIRRKEQTDAYGLTFKLLTTSDGKKMGKTAAGALWLDPKKTSPFDFYQYWRNIDDAGVINSMKMLTFISIDEINDYANMTDASINEAKKRLAFEVTKIIHGEANAAAAQKQTEDIFEKAGRSDSMARTIIGRAELDQGVLLLDVLLRAGLVPSKGEGRRLMQQNGIYLNDRAVADLNYKLSASDFTGGEAIVRKGKKIFHALRLE